MFNAFVTPVVKHWQERETAQQIHSIKLGCCFALLLVLLLLPQVSLTQNIMKLIYNCT